MESSLPWGGTLVGDAGPYTDDNWSDTWRKLFMHDRAAEGVLIGYENELEVTGVASPIGADTGAALVDGKFYENDALIAVAVPAPVVDTRYDRIVLEKDFAAQTVRVVREAGVEGAGVPPALVQVDGVTWQISLATLSVTVLGVIEVTDAREFVGSPLAALYAPEGATREISAGGAIRVDRKSFYRVDTNGAAATDDLDTVTGGYDGQVIILASVNAARVVTLTAAGNLAPKDGAPITLSAPDILVVMRYDDTAGEWNEVARAGGGGADILEIQTFS